MRIFGDRLKMTLFQKFLVCLGLCLAGSCAPLCADEYAELLEQAKAGASEADLLDEVKNAEHGYQMSLARIEQCKQAGISENVIMAMVRLDAPPPPHNHGMDRVVISGFGVTITWWKLLGYVGTVIFAGRWLLQMYSSRKAGRPVTTAWFWIISFFGSLLCLAYWVFSPKRDSVGVFQNLFPAFVALYNLYLEVRYHKRVKEAELAQAVARKDAEGLPPPAVEMAVSK